MTSHFVSPKAKIGAGTTIGPFAYIGPNVEIGENCEIQPGAVIGSAGYGYEKFDGGWGERLSHDEGVILGDEVHVGANAVIDAGSWRPTRIGRRSRIDSLAFLAHNVQLGERVMVAAAAEISGSVDVGDEAWIAPKAAIKQRLTIGRKAVVGLGAVVVRSVPDGEIWAGVPARRLDG